MESTNIPDYVPLTLKGAGTYGYVLEAYDRNKDIRVAIKRTHKIGTKLSREYEILSELTECEYIVKLFDVFYTTNDDKKIIQNLVFEYIPKSLDKYIEQFKLEKKIIPIETIKRISKQLLKGINYCHKKNIIHRDLKPENILFTDNYQVKICDFGSAKKLNLNSQKYGNNSKSSPYISTRYYRAPELFFGKYDYDTKIDIFSAGCIIAELFILNPLFLGINDGMQVFEYMNVLGLPDKNYLKSLQVNKSFLDILDRCKNLDPYSLNELLNPNNKYNKKDIDEVSDLLYKMLCWDYNKRYTAEECLNHKFLKDVDISNKKNIK